jgi:hypothetical protein
MTEPLDPEKLAATYDRLSRLRDEALRALVDGDLSMLTLCANITTALAALEEAQRPGIVRKSQV